MGLSWLRFGLLGQATHVRLRLGVCLSWPGFNDDAAVDAVRDVDSASFSLGWLLFPLPSPYPYLLLPYLLLA